jgi:NAD-specific glutamate dehydrogenase
VIYRWLLGLARVLERTTRWVLANVDADASAEPLIREYLDGLRKLRGSFETVVTGEERQLFEARVAEMREFTQEADLAASLITLRFLDQLLEILKTAATRNRMPLSASAAPTTWLPNCWRCRCCARRCSARLARAAGTSGLPASWTRT